MALSLSLSLSLDFLIKTPSPKLFSFSRCFEVIGCCELIDNDGSLSLSLSLSRNWVVVMVNVVVGLVRTSVI